MAAFAAPLAVAIVGRPTISSRRRRRTQTMEEANKGALIGASYARYSSDQQREESITDQRRKCREMAEHLGVSIAPELEYADEAVSGTKRCRKGLDQLLQDAEAGEFQVLFFHSLSRLSRESVITMPMLKRLVHVCRIRVISVSEGIDSSKDGWDVIASIMALLHERYIKELSANVFRGQEGTILAGYSVGDTRFGYRSEPVLGSEQTRVGRNAKPRMAYVVDSVTAPWVVRIFHWFVVERRSLRWIARELNQRSAPKDHRSTKPHWHHQQVVNLLSSPKYVGVWTWGEMQNRRDPLTGNIRQEARPEEDCARWTRNLPELRIVDQAVFDEAQRLLDENYSRYAATRRSDGRHNGSRPSQQSPRHLLSGLIECAECGATFHVGGSHGKYLFCPNNRKGVCGCKTQLRRDLAEHLILQVIGARILADPEWCRAVYDETRKAWKALEDSVPTQLAATQQELSDVERKISRIVDRIENGLDDPSVEARLTEHRLRRRDLARRVDHLERTADSRGPEPTEEQVRQKLLDLGSCLAGDEPAAAHALRELVGGAIIVSEVRRDGRSRHYLRGRLWMLSTNISRLLHASVGGDNQVPACSNSLLEDEIVIDFVVPNPLDAKAVEARQLYDQGLASVAIARELGCSRSNVTKLIRHSFSLEGKAMPDGRSRRATRRHEP